MSDDVRLRVIVRKPPVGVAFAMQSGSDALIAPNSTTSAKLTFETTVKLRAAADGRLRLSGPVVQGSGDKRFVYINSGKRAGQKDTFWDRRAKVFLTGIGAKQLRAAKDAVLEAEIDGVAKDGGPCCATVPLLGGWRVV
jgi:hypothetical protein